MPLFRVSAPGTKSSEAPRFGISIFADRTSSGWLKVASAYLDRFWNELSANPKSIDEATRRHYAKLYARPGAMHSAFNQFAAFTQDAVDNKALAAKGKLAMPVLAIGAEKSFGAAMADELRHVATDVTSAVIPNSGHWLMEEQPRATIVAIVAFLNKR